MKTAPAAVTDSASNPATSRVNWQSLGERWPRRAQACVYRDEGLAYDLERPDFDEALLPFARHPHWLDLGDGDRHALLAWAWLIYNRKQVELEQAVVLPACLALLSGEVPGASDDAVRTVMAQTVTDEVFHVSMIERACDVTVRARELAATGLDRSALPACNPVARMRAEMARHGAPWRKHVVQFATAVVSEVFICSYLRRLAASDVIQPLNAQVTRAHLTDELAHGSIFRGLWRNANDAMDRKQRAFFATVLPQAVAWFGQCDTAPWLPVLERTGVPGWRDLLHDCRNSTGPVADFAPLFRACDEIDLPEVRQRALELIGQRHEEAEVIP
jgi:hypothetical protein